MDPPGGGLRNAEVEAKGHPSLELSEDRLFWVGDAGFLGVLAGSSAAGEEEKEGSQGRDLGEHSQSLASPGPAHHGEVV